MHQLSIKLKDNEDIIVKIEGEKDTLVDIISIALDKDEKFAQLLLESIIRWKMIQGGGTHSETIKICLN